ncbi:hypothetical protein, partial [Pseudonocardia pini]|uniref:hypothetical protein n=1 Tax=Pseudonocardia pini TaxID=2758030 RepID=UPI001C692DBE
MVSGTTPEQPERPLQAAPARHRLSMEDLEPAAPARAPVASFDEEPAVVAVRVADFGAAPAAGDGVGVEAGGEPGDGVAAEQQARETLLVGFDELEPAPDRQHPPAELGALTEASGDAPQLTMDDLRFGRRGARADRGA